MDGNLLASWGGPGEEYEWPENEHGIFVDYKDNGFPVRLNLVRRFWVFRQNVSGRCTGSVNCTSAP